MESFKVIIVEDVPLELKGTEGIIRSDIPEAQIVGTATNETEYWRLMKENTPDLVLLDLGLGGSTTVGVELCRETRSNGIILKTDEMLTRTDVISVMSGKKNVFNQPILNKILERFKKGVKSQIMRQEALINFEIDEYDERFLRHLALGYTKEQITGLRGIPFGVKSLEKRQNELVQKLFPGGGEKGSVNATRLVVRALELRILDIDNLQPDEE